MTEKSQWPIAAARDLLSSALRNVLDDRAFGDKEMSWHTDSGDVVAHAYFSPRSQQVWLPETEEYCATNFEGQEAQELRGLGRPGTYERNDEQY